MEKFRSKKEKIIAIIIFLTVSINLFGQQLTFKGELMDTLKVISNRSYYHFDSCGTTTGVYDEYIIAYNKSVNKYFLSTYQRTEYKLTFKPDTSILEEKILKAGKEIDRNLILNLLKEFEIAYIKPTFDNIGISKKKFLKLTNKKHVKKVAKWYEQEWHFKRTYSTKEEIEELFAGFQKPDTFNLYLETVYDTSSGYIIVADVDDHFGVIISTSKNKYQFEGKYPNPYKQPWYNYTNSFRFDSKSIINFSINRALLELLPKKFSGVSTLKVEALIIDYIQWYLQRRRIIFHY
jgi:hypothetical protein